MEYFGFTETGNFERKALDLIGDEGISRLQIYLCKYPTSAPVIPASGGIRKLRWSASGRGRRGGTRVIYFFAASEDRLILLDIYAKNQKSNLRKEELNKLVITVKEWLEQIQTQN